MLLVNLLSNYLPPPQASSYAAITYATTSAQTVVSQHPDYAQRVQQLPAYRESLHVRYPPVCVNCLPAVEDAIEQKNQMARTKALGGWLKESKGKERQRLISGSGKDRERLGLQLAIWRVRGALWWTTLLCVLVTHAAGGSNCFIRWIPLISPPSDSRLRFSRFACSSHPCTPYFLSFLSLLYSLGPNLLSLPESKSAGT